MLQARLSRYKLTRSEISGAFADLGLLIPLEAALIAVNGLNPTSTLLGVGIFYIAAGWFFDLPMPVQPLKALAAIAIARELSPDVIAAGALLMSLSLGFLAVTGLIDRLYAIVPQPVVRGIQLGLAYVLIRGAFELMAKPLSLTEAAPQVALGSGSLPLMIVIAPAAVALILFLTRTPIVPASLAVLASGVGVGLYLGRWQGAATFGPAPMSLAIPNAEAFGTAAAVLLTAQLPLTLANSVIATADASRHYFPNAVNTTPRKLSFSIALGNVWAGLFGGLPVCHGSGGLTAHYRLGARTPVATALLGAVLILIALAFGQTAQSVRMLVPLPFFGILLLFVGIQHIVLATSVEKRSDLTFVALAGVLAVVLNGNLAYVAALTLAAYWATRGIERLWPGLLRPLDASGNRG